MTQSIPHCSLLMTTHALCHFHGHVDVLCRSEWLQHVRGESILRISRHHGSAPGYCMRIQYCAAQTDCIREGRMNQAASRSMRDERLLEDDVRACLRSMNALAKWCAQLKASGVQVDPCVPIIGQQTWHPQAMIPLNAPMQALDFAFQSCSLEPQTITGPTSCEGSECVAAACPLNAAPYLLPGHEPAAVFTSVLTVIAQDFDWAPVGATRKDLEQKPGTHVKRWPPTRERRDSIEGELCSCRALQGSGRAPSGASCRELEVRLGVPGEACEDPAGHS